MTTELRKELRWWWENRPIKDVGSVFICLDEAECVRDHYGQPFKYRLQFMHRLCELADVKPFGFHAIRHLTASILRRKGYELGAIQAILAWEVLEDLARSKKGEVAPFKHWPQKIALPGLQE
jgi:integrase